MPCLFLCLLFTDVKTEFQSCYSLLKTDTQFLTGFHHSLYYPLFYSLFYPLFYPLSNSIPVSYTHRDVYKRQILLNGSDIQKYNYEEYMGIFSVVFQDFKLFSFSLGQNVAANADYDKARVEYCLKRAGFGERLAQMPNGTDTCLYKDFSETGVEISGGEAQKIALARALYKDAPFIVLDEPTSALDPVAEAEVYSKFNEIEMCIRDRP